MANTIDSTLVDRMYAMGLMALRKRLSITKYVSRYDLSIAQDANKFQNIVVPIAPRMDDAATITPGTTPPAANDITLEFAQISLNNWKGQHFHFTDLELSQLQAGTMPDQMDSCIDALARTVASSIWANHTGVYNAVGAAGTTPFASSVAVVQDARKLLNKAGASFTDRSVLLGFDAEANAIGLPLFQQVDQAGTSATQNEGYIGRKIGFDWDTDGYNPSFTGGTLSNGTGKLAKINDAAVAIGDTAVPMDDTSLTGTLVVGDIFTVAGDDQQYVVTANATAASNAIASVAFDPPAVVAWADDAVVTFVASHDVAGLAMQKSAIGFASRPLAVTYEGGSIIRQIPDPQSGLVLTMEISRQYMQTMVQFSMLWGSTLIRPECAVKILG